jgi:hypothetical protein
MYRIHVDTVTCETVEADNETAAVMRWLDIAGFDSVEHAASEYFCEPADIYATKFSH